MTTALTLAAAAVGPTSASAEVSAAELPTRAIAKDPAGDAIGDGALPRRRADVRRASYRTPTTEDGTITVRVTWATLRRTGPFQRLHVFVDPRTSGKRQPSSFEGGRAGVVVHTYRNGDANAYRVKPEVLDVVRTYGVGGTTTITLSTEWLDADAAELSVFAEAGQGRTFAFDTTGGRMLRVGPTR